MFYEVSEMKQGVCSVCRHIVLKQLIMALKEKTEPLTFLCPQMLIVNVQNIPVNMPVELGGSSCGCLVLTPT